MKYTIDTDVLEKEGLSFKEFLLLLLNYHDVDIGEVFGSLVEKGLACPNVFHPDRLVVSGNTKELVARVLTASAVSDNQFFLDVAEKLQWEYPDGNKPGTTHPWRGKDTEEIAQKLRVLSVYHNFKFTEEEAINAVREYISDFPDDKSRIRMRLLRNFILRTKADGEILSDFMTIIENHRNETDN